MVKEKFDYSKVCRFYQQGNCKFAKGCLNEHPKFCQKFKNFGLKKFNTKGCDESCDKYHPRGCFESMKSKTCHRNECKFFHVSGTKKVEDEIKPVQQQTQSGYFNAKEKTAEVKLNQVFQKAKEPWENAIEKMALQMEKLMAWQQQMMQSQSQTQTQIQPLMHPQTQAGW